MEWLGEPRTCSCIQNLNDINDEFSECVNDSVLCNHVFWVVECRPKLLLKYGFCKKLLQYK